MAEWGIEPLTAEVFPSKIRQHLYVPNRLHRTAREATTADETRIEHIITQLEANNTIRFDRINGFFFHINFIPKH